MTAGAYNFTIEQGTTFVRHFVYKDSNGAVVNLTGYTARLQVRSYKESSVVLIEATTANGKLVITPTEGKITMTLTATELNSVTFDNAVYDLEIESNTGVVTRLLEGCVVNSLQVTR